MRLFIHMTCKNWKLEQASGPSAAKISLPMKRSTGTDALHYPELFYEAYKDSIIIAKRGINCTFSVSVVANKFKAIYNERKGGITYEIQIRRLYG